MLTCLARLLVFAVLSVSAASAGSQERPPGLPAVDVDALMQQVNTLAAELRTEAERLLKEEGADKAIERLRAEAKADEKVAFRRMNLAAVVAVLAQQDETAATIVAKETPAATDAELPLGLARHALLIQSGKTKARTASAGDLTWQSGEAKSFEGQLSRYAVILRGLERLAPDSLEVARSLNHIGNVYGDRGDLDTALQYHQRSLAIRERLAPDSLDVAASLNNVGYLCGQRGDLDAAFGYLGRSLAIRERLAPDSLPVARSLMNIGSLYLARSNLDRALDYVERSLAIQERLAPDSRDAAMSLGNIGYLRDQRGDLDAALDYYQRCLKIEERLTPDSLDVAASLNNMGSVYAHRGDLDTALQYHQRSLAIKERLAPDSLAVAGSLNNTGSVYKNRGDLDAALHYYQRSLAIQERRAPDSLAVAASLNNIGTVYSDRRDLDAALDYYQRSLAIQERLAPDSLAVATSLANIGQVDLERGHLDQALDYCQRSLKIRERLAPDSLAVATSLANIGGVYNQRGELDTARGYFERGLAIYERLAPESVDVAVSLNNIGSVYALRSDLDAALRYGRRAVETLEKARAKVGGEGQTRATFLARYTGYYRSLLHTLLAMGRVEEAAATAERMRARSFLELVAERSLGAAGNPALVAKQRTLDVRRDRLYGELQGAGGKAPDEKRSQAVTAELQRIALDQEAVEREIKQSDPRYAALEYPEPMTVAQLKDALDPGTVVLLYVVSQDTTYLFVFGPGIETSAHEIKAKNDELGQKAGFLLGLIAGRQDASGAAKALGELLLHPAAKEIAHAKRLLILPDGPLWALPFQALPIEGRTYLCDRLPVHYAPSGTVFVEGRKFRAASRQGQRLLAYGAPDYSAWKAKAAGSVAYLPVRSGVFEALRSTPDGTGFAELPSSGLEAKVVAGLFADGADVREGLQATEASVRDEGPGRRVLHLACHGLLDPASPMDSALVLSLPQEPAEGNDGFLKAWEVFGLDLAGCDLVTLSACETARGKTLSGEGVVGLTRAFLYAGAASVLCTQWKVADDSTAALMACFYTHYREGDSKDVALQKAMREIRTGRMANGRPLVLPKVLGQWKSAWAHPYYWAPFILMGEYQQTGVRRAGP